MSKAAHLAITGDLTINRIADALQRVTAALTKMPLVIDLSGTRDADSSAVAFLLNCLRIARARGIAVTFTAVPEQILTLADIYGLKAVIADALEIA